MLFSQDRAFSAVALLFFVSFVLINAVVLINVVVAVLLEKMVDDPTEADHTTPSEEDEVVLAKEESVAAVEEEEAPTDFAVGESVRFRDEGQEWRNGVVTSTQPLEVKPEGWDKGLKWAFVEKALPSASSDGPVLRHEGGEWGSNSACSSAEGAVIVEPGVAEDSRSSSNALRKTPGDLGQEPQAEVLWTDVTDILAKLGRDMNGMGQGLDKLTEDMTHVKSQLACIKGYLKGPSNPALGDNACAGNEVAGITLSASLSIHTGENLRKRSDLPP